ncbi:MAG: mersacidin/lichenicidin family type 2 lantibiotic [Acidobacteriota bacterium]
MKSNLNANDIVRAWKDADFRASLENAPDSPAGVVEIDDSFLAGVGGAQEVGISITNTSTFCTVSGWQVSCGHVCTLTTECGCTIFD